MPRITIDPELRLVEGHTVFDPGRTKPRWRATELAANYGFAALVTVDVGSRAVRGDWSTSAIVMDVLFALVACFALVQLRERRRHPRQTEPFIVPDDLLTEIRTLQSEGQVPAAARLIRERTRVGLTDSLALVRLATADAAPTR